MSWQHKEPGHQQPWYWPGYADIYQFQQDHQDQDPIEARIICGIRSDREIVSWREITDPITSSVVIGSFLELGAGHQQPWYWPGYLEYYSFSTRKMNSLWPSDTIWRHKSRSTLAQVMACCLMAPSHYLNQCWLIIIKVWWHSSEGNFMRDPSATIH